MPAVTPHVYCTYFDSGYLTRGLALMESLRAGGDDAEVWILALDDATRDYFEGVALPGVRLLAMSDIEQAEPELPPLKAQRSRMEYIFTSTPLVMRWVANQQRDPETVVIYLDADLYFFDRPSLVLDALGSGAVGIIEHKYPAAVAGRLAKYGRFNVGWVGISCTAEGRACLDWWAQSTLAWCLDRPEDGKYADQGYLDRFPQKFEGVVILPSAGFNLAPWNTRAAVLTANDGHVIVDGSEPLVFFHFHGLRRLGERYVSSQFVYGSHLGPVLKNDVYAPYVRALESEERRVAGVLQRPASHPRGNGIRGVASRARKLLVDRLTILTGNAIRISDAEGSTTASGTPAQRS